MSGIRQVMLVLFITQILAVNIWISSATLSDPITEVDITIQTKGTQPTNTIPTYTEIYHHTPSKKDSSPETSPIETQLTEAVTQPNPADTPESAIDSAATLGTDYASTLGSNIKQTTYDRTNNKITDITTAESKTVQSHDPRSNENVNTRTNKVVTDNTPSQTELQRDFTNLVESLDSDESVFTQINAVTNEQTTGVDLHSDKGTISRDGLTTGKDPVVDKGQVPTGGKDAVVNEETTERGSSTPLEETTFGSTHDPSTNENTPAVQEIPGTSGTSSKDLPADGVTSNDGVIGTVEGTDVVTDVVTVTETLGTKEFEVVGNKTGQESVKNVTYVVLTTAAPATTEKLTTSSPYLTTPCIQENPNITEISIEVCLCQPVEGATYYIATTKTVEWLGFYLRAGQNETDMDDDFDMAEDSKEADKEVQFGNLQEYHNTTVRVDGASLCAHFTNLTSGRVYNFTIQAFGPTLPPQAISEPLLAQTRAAKPILKTRLVSYSRVSLRWHFNHRIFLQYYNITYRWGDQIGFAATNLPGSQLEWDIYGLMPGGTYIFRVIVETQWTSTFSEVKRTMQLYQPRSFIRQQTPTSVNLAWTYDDDTFVEHYTIKYTLLNTNETKVVLLPGPWLEDNNFNVTGLTSGGSYRIQLIAESGNRAKSTELRMHTELIKPTLDFTYTNDTTLGVNWGFDLPVVFEYYNFSYSLIPSNHTTASSPGVYGRIETILPLWQNNVSLTDLIPGARYDVQLQAVGELTSSMAQMVKGTKPQSPTGIKVLFVDATTIELAWNQTYIDHVEFFRIILKSDRTGKLKEMESLGPVAIIRGLSPGDNYRIRITTVSYGEESKPPTKIQQRTKLKGPVTIIITEYTDSTVTIKWRIPRNNVVNDWTLWCEGPGCDLENPDTYIYLKSKQTHGKHTFDGLKSGEKYQFVVNVWSDLENLEGSVYQNTAPKRPVNLKVIDYSATSISISWEAPINSTIQEYLVTYQGMMERVTSNNSFSLVRRSLGADIENLIPGDFYMIKVQSVTNGAKSVPVEEVQSTKLAKVARVKSHSTTNNSFILEWDGAAGYYDNVRVQCSNCSYTQVYRSVPKTSNRITFTNLKSGSMYVVKLITMRSGFMDSEPVAFQASTYPDSPSRLHIISLSDRQITLQWSGTPCEGCNVDFYYIDKVSDDGEALHNDGVSCSPSANGQDKICTKSFQNLHPGHLYTFTVTAVSFSLRSQKPFVYQQRTKPGIPGDITFNLIDKWRIIATWMAAEGMVDSYIINIRSGPGNVDESREVPYNSRQLDFTRLKPGRPYTIRIIANVDGLVSNARSIVVHTLPDIPSRVHNFKIKAVSPVEVLATYSEPKQPNGIIEAYHISYYGSTSKGKPCPSVLDRKLSGTSTKVSIRDLYAGCNYTISITASTGAGKGHPVTQYVRTPIGAPKATGRQPGVPASDDIHRDSFTVTFDTTFFDEAYGEINSYAILVAESTTINSHTVDSKNITTLPAMMTWAEAVEYDIIPRYQISEQYLYAELYEGDTQYGRRRRRDAVFSRDITIGKDKCSKGETKEYCNGPLKSGRSYVYQFRGFSDNGYSDTEFSPPIPLPSDQTGLIVGISVVLVVLFIIVMILAVMVIGRRWKYVPYRGKYMLANTSEPLTGTMTSKGSRASKIKFSRPVLLSEFCQDYHTMNAHSHYGFSQEYEAIRKVGKKMNCNAAVLPDNVSKNRYTNILPYDKTRVKLSSIDDDEGSDYINANYVPGFNSPREFIACQGPLPGTTDDTWKMIWEHNVATVVMVTQLVEKGKVKCDQYWPEDHKAVLYGDIQITMTSSTEQQDWNVREFTLQKAENVKKVKHINYVSWPDHGVPESSDVLLGFIRFVRQQIPRNGTPTIVHCSAGVGRTGTFICLDRILHHIEEFDFVDIMAFVAEMRMHRNYMVQTEQQYVFIHRCVLDILEAKGIAPTQTPSSINGDAADHSCKV